MRIWIFVTLVIIGLAAVPALSEAQAPPVGPCKFGDANDPLCLKNLEVFKLPSGGAGKAVAIITAIINLLLGLSAVLAVAAIIWGAVRIITSLGNQSGVESGKKIIFWAIIGLLIIGFAFAIIQLIGEALGVLQSKKAP